MRVSERLDVGLRTLATGLSFASFGLGGMLLSITLFPILKLLSRDVDTARRRIQLAMHYTFRVFVWEMKMLGLLSYEVVGRERLLQRGKLVVANHPSLIDVVFLIALMPEVDCIVKQALWRNPFTRGPVSWASYIPNSGSSERLIEEAASNLRMGRSLIIFPEGTRSVPGQPLSMQRGAARIAAAARANIVPVTILCEPATLTKAEPWYQVPRRRPNWKLVVGETLSANDYAPVNEPPSLVARRLTEFFLSYFTNSLAALGSKR